MVRSLKLPVLAAFFHIYGMQVSSHRGHVQDSTTQDGRGTDGASHANVPANMVRRLGGANSLPSRSQIVLKQGGPVGYNS